MDFRHGTILRWIAWFLLGLSAAAGQDGGKLTGAVGGDITFPASVKTSGSLEYRDKAICQVLKGDSEVYIEDFRERLQWNRQTGLFTIRELRINDTGPYTVKDSIGQNNSLFHLTVYNQVSKPQVRAAAPCWVECSVENGRDVSLSWYRGEERLNQTSSPDLSRVLSLVLVSDSNTSYSCVVENPVSRESVNMPDTCRTIGDPKPDGVEGRLWVSTVVAVSCSVFIIVFVLLVVYLKRKTPAHTQQGSVIYQNWARV
ncbi:hepatic and glial cell adhesion molecule-like isoform X2 [Osmerus eperlanus]|uniref:hepatic and glial cell adhesion molecule-like isoform X2 n=1 Tax=Osmerus eperlanus TaxID=29151 RepID=UPI002E0FEE14